MNKYKNLEKKIIKKILSGNDPLLSVIREQHKRAQLDSVDETEVGVFFNYTISNKSGLKKFEEDFRIGDVLIYAPNSEFPVGALLFIKNGYLSFLELHSYDDFLPDLFGQIRLEYTHSTRSLPNINVRICKKIK